MSQSESQVPICVIHGKNTFARREAIERIVERELDGGDETVNLSPFDGDQVDVAEVLDDVRTYSLLGGRRVVVIEDADGFVSKHRPVLERYTAAPAETGCLILVCSTFDARTRLFKAVAQIGEIVDCKPLKDHVLDGWIAARALQTYGKRMDRYAAVRLLDHAGSSQEGLDQELAKLSLYVGRREEITADDVDELVGHYREQNVFGVMDAISDGDANKALEQWRQVIASDPAATGRALGGLAWALRRLIDAARRCRAGESVTSIARSQWTRPEVLGPRLKRTSVERCEAQLSDLLAADLDSKTGGATLNVAVERFIVKHSKAVA